MAGLRPSFAREFVVPPTDGNTDVAGVVRLRKTRLVDEATHVLRDMILSGKLAAGARVRQLELARQMGISRTPLREALMKLEQEGLITMLRGGGLQVVEFDTVGAVDLYEIREMLDGLAARMAAQRANPQSLKKLESHLARMKRSIETQNAHDWFIHHVAFHEEIFEASGNKRLLGLTSVVRLSIQRFHPLLLTTKNRLRNALREHESVFEAIRARAPEKAENLARLHITNAKEIVADVMTEQHRLSQVQGR